MAGLNNRLDMVVNRIDAKLIKLEKAAKKSTVPPFGMERLSTKDSLKRLGQLPAKARERTVRGWTPQEKQKAMDELGGPDQFMEFLDQ